MIVKSNMGNNVANVAKLFKNENIKKIINDEHFTKTALEEFYELNQKLNLENMDISKFYAFFFTVKNVGYDTNEANKNDKSGFRLSQITKIIKDKITPDQLFYLVQAYSTEWTILLGLLLGEKIEQKIKQEVEWLSELETNKLKYDKNKKIQQMVDETKATLKRLTYLEDCLLFKVDQTQTLGRTSIRKMQNANDQQGNKAKNNLGTELNRIFVETLFKSHNNEQKVELVAKDIENILKCVANSRQTHLMDDAMNKQIKDTSLRLAPAFKVWSGQFDRLHHGISSLISDYRNKTAKSSMIVGLTTVWNKNNKKINKEEQKQQQQQENKEVKAEENKETNKEKEKKEQAINELTQKAEYWKSSDLYKIYCNCFKKPKKVVKYNNDRKLAQERLYHNKDTNKFRKQRLKNIEERKKELFNTDQNGKIIIGTKKISKKQEREIIDRLSKPNKKPMQANTENSGKKLTEDEQQELIYRLYYKPMGYKPMGKGDKSGKNLTNLHNNKIFITELK